MSARPLKILFSGEFPRTKNYGGSHTVNVEILNHLEKDGRFEVLAVSPIFEGETAPDLGLPLEFLPTPYLRSKSFSDLRARTPYVRAVLRKIGEFQPDLVHIDAFPFLANQIDAHIPKTLFLHGSATQSLDPLSFFHPYSFAMKFLESRDEARAIWNPSVKTIFINSEYSRDALVRGQNVPVSLTSKIEALKLGYNIARFGTGTDEKRHDPVLLFVGGISDHKGQRDLIRAMPQILKSVPNTILVLVGKDAGDLTYCKKEALRLGIAQSVTFKGSTSDKELGILFRTADLYISAAIEGFGINQVEAMAMGLPLVAWDKGAISELFTDGEEGFLVKNEGEFIERTLLLLQDPELRKAMGERAKRHAEKTYSWEALAERVAETYNSILSNEA